MTKNEKDYEKFVKELVSTGMDRGYAEHLGGLLFRGLKRRMKNNLEKNIKKGFKCCFVKRISPCDDFWPGGFRYELVLLGNDGCRIRTWGTAVEEVCDDKK